jgi:hypothetical protein
LPAPWTSSIRRTGGFIETAWFTLCRDDETQPIPVNGCSVERDWTFFPIWGTLNSQGVMTASAKESVHPPAEDVRVPDEGAAYSKRDEDFVRLLQAAGLACELDTSQLGLIASMIAESRVYSRRMDILERYYRGSDDASIAMRRRDSDRFFMHDDGVAVNAHQLVASLASLHPELGQVNLQRIGSDEGPLVLRAGENFSAVTDEDDEDAETGTVAVRALVRALNALLAKADVAERLVPLIPDESRELYLGVTEEGAMTLLQGGCTELSAVAALREFASW